MKDANVTISSSEKISLVGSLATMLSSGIPILEVVNSLIEDAKGGQKKILEALRADLTQGKHVYISFSRFPLVFDKVTVSILKASEEAGTLDVTLRDLRKNIQKEIEFSDKIKTALVYPVFIMVVFMAVLLLMLFFVIPKIASVFSRLRAELPLPTKVLIFTSTILVKYTWAVALITGAVLFLLFILYKKKRAAMMNVITSLPLISNLMRLIDLTRFTRSMFLLLSSGLPITAALELSGEVVNKRETARIVKYSREMVLGGKMLSQGLRTSKGYIPTIMIKLVEAGEKTGTLDKSMQDISEYFDYQVSTNLKTLTALLEPIMLVIVGGMVGGMMLTIIAPIYSIIGQVGAR